MSDLSDTPRSEGLCPLSERVRFARWLLLFVDSDRSVDYREAFWDLLRALLIQYQADGKDDIEPRSLSTQELWRCALDGRRGSVDGLTSEKARKRVNDHWSALVESFAELQGRFTDAARKQRFTGLLWPTKNQSEGGRSSTYRLEWRPFSVSTALPTLPADYEKLPFVLRYHEDRSSLRFSFFGQLFLWPLLFRQQGDASMRIEGVRRYVPAVGLGLMILLVGLLVALALMQMGRGVLEWAWIAVAAVFYWFPLRPLMRLYDRSIIMASPLFYPFSESECQVELVRDPEAAMSERVKIVVT